MNPDEPLPSEFSRLFPTARSLERHSEPTDRYNCFAFAAGDAERWWDPYAPEGFWPEGVPRGRDFASVQKAFESLGYELCGDGALEEGFEKVAVYLLIYDNHSPAKVTHMARQLEDGRWASKVGADIDVLHAILDLYGPAYGYYAKFLRRSRVVPDAR